MRLPSCHRHGATLFGIGVDAHVSGEFIGAAETLLASRMGADVGLLAGVSANVAGLVFETVEGARAERTLVRTRDLRLVHGVVAGGEGGCVGGWIRHVGSGGLCHFGSAKCHQARGAVGGTRTGRVKATDG